MKNSYLLFLACFFVISCSSDDDIKLEPLGLLENKFGVWEGTGMQLDLSWSIKITLKDNEQRIEYPSLSCGGYLSFISETTTSILFRETITVNNSCADQGFVELIVISDETMDYNYYMPNNENKKGELAAWGSVSKTN